MISRNLGSPAVQTFQVYCDVCPSGEEFFAESWNDLMAQMREEGWKSHRRGEEWKRSCPACTEAALD